MLNLFISFFSSNFNVSGVMKFALFLVVDNFLRLLSSSLVSKKCLFTYNHSNITSKLAWSICWPQYTISTSIHSLVANKSTLLYNKKKKKKFKKNIQHKKKIEKKKKKKYVSTRKVWCLHHCKNAWCRWRIKLKSSG